MFTALVVRVLRADRPSAGAFFALGGLAGAAFLTRYDSTLAFLPILAGLAWTYRHRPALWLAGAVAAVIAGSWLVFSQIYYGDLFPTSVYVKLGLFQSAPELSVLGVINFLLVSGLFLLVPVLRPFAALRQQNRAMALAFIVALTLLSIYALRASGLHMMFGYRLFVPYIPALGLVLACCAARLPGVAVGGVLALDLGMGAVLGLFSLNPGVLTHLPGRGAVEEPEYRDLSPRAYGAFMQVLEQQAAELRTHWAAQNRGDEIPVVFLYTGGTGYWLRDFYVYETLIKYRHACPTGPKDLLNAVHYFQDFEGVIVNAEVRAGFFDRPDVAQTPDYAVSQEIMFPKPYRLGPALLGMAFAPQAQPIVFAPRIDAPCPAVSGDDG